MPDGSASKARTAAALSPSTSMMSRDGAPRANEISCMPTAYESPQPDLGAPMLDRRSCDGVVVRTTKPSQDRRSSMSSGDRCAALHPHPDDVAHGDDAEHVVLLHHHEVPETTPDHRGCGLLEGPRRPSVDHLPGDVRSGALDVGVETRADRVEDVALGDDADARAVGVGDDRGTEPPAGHQAGGVAQSVVGSQLEDRLAHGVSNLHLGITPRNARYG